MAKVLFRGGKFDGRAREFGSDPMNVIELDGARHGPICYVRTDTMVGDAVVYEFNADARGSLPFTVHFRGGPHNGRGRHFTAKPSDVLVIPCGGGEFARYRLDTSEAGPGQPLLYVHAETFRGES